MSKIKLVIFDLDETLWSMEEGYCSILRPPLQQVGPDTIVDSIGRKIELYGGVRELLQSLGDAGIILSVASKNDPEPATEVMKRFRIYDFFTYPQLEWGPKVRLVKRLLAILAERDGLEILPKEALLVDDWRSNVNEVSGLGVRTLLLDSDITHVDEVRDLVLEDDL